MSKTNYVDKIWWLRIEIENNFKELIKSKGGNILIPYYYFDEDDIDDDIQTLIDDEYDVRIGCPYDNMVIPTINMNDYRKDVEVVAFSINKKTDRIEFVSKESNIYDISDIDNIQTLAIIFEKVENLFQ